jgi:hypothetical protein
LLGRALRDVAVLMVQSILFIVLAVPFGLRAPFGGVVVALVLVGVLALAMSSASYALALRSRRIAHRPVHAQRLWKALTPASASSLGGRTICILPCRSRGPRPHPGSGPSRPRAAPGHAKSAAEGAD